MRQNDSPGATYETVVLGYGNHASIEIPDEILIKLGANRRAPLKITIHNHTYQSTAIGVGGKCMVVFPTRDREASGAKAGDRISVTLELDQGYRHVDVPKELHSALEACHMTEMFHDLTYSKRRELARQIADAKSDETKMRRIHKIIADLTGGKVV